jgi:hypothetical protein
MSAHVLEAIDSIQKARQEYGYLLQDKQNNHGSTPSAIKRKLELLRRAERILTELKKG